MNQFKKYQLKNIKSYYEIAEFCSEKSNTDFCSSEKNLVCKTTLNIHNLKTNFSSNFDYCEIMSELIKLSKKAGVSVTDHNYLNPNHKPINKQISKHGSDLLKIYMKFNNIVIKNSKNTTTIKHSTSI